MSAGLSRSELLRETVLTPSFPGEDAVFAGGMNLEKVEFRRGGNKILFKKNVLEGRQNREDTFIIPVLSQHPFHSPCLGFLKPLGKRTSGVPKVGALAGVGAGGCHPQGLPPAPWHGGTCTLREGQTGTGPPQPLSLFGLFPGTFVFSPCQLETELVGR